MAGVTFSNCESLFGKTLKSRVNQYFKDSGIDPRASTSAWVKSAALIFLSVLTYGVLVSGKTSLLATLLLCVFEGLLIATIGFNVMHEAVHGNFSKNRKTNKLISYTMDLYGVSQKLYTFKHTIVHHTYTNVTGQDHDIETNGVFRLSPQQQHRHFYRFQPIYAPFLYLFVTLEWIWNADFAAIKAKGYGPHKIGVFSKQERILLYLFKFLHLVTALLVPLIFCEWIHVLGCYLLIHSIAGLILGHVFQLGHIVEGTAFPMPDESNQISGGWSEHQLRTTSNFANSNRFLTWYLGGLNFQVEHHLFPRISYVWYPKIKPIVMKTCQEFGVPYLEFKTLSSAVAAHYRCLVSLGSASQTQPEIPFESNSIIL
jgi:linoleoyl-CoA desaturase